MKKRNSKGSKKNEAKGGEGGKYRCSAFFLDEKQFIVELLGGTFAKKSGLRGEASVTLNEGMTMNGMCLI